MKKVVDSIRCMKVWGVARKEVPTCEVRKADVLFCCCQVTSLPLGIPFSGWATTESLSEAGESRQGSRGHPGTLDQPPRRVSCPTPS
jgi:hypothetical protein